MEIFVLILYVEGHAQGRKEIKTCEETMQMFDLSYEQLRHLIDSGEVYDGKCFDEMFDFRTK